MATDAGTLVQESPASPAESVTASPPAPSEDGAKATAGKKSKAKEPKGKKSKGADSKSTKDAPDASGTPSVAAHPRAARSVARAKGWGGLAGFLIAGYLSLPTGTLAGAALRALVAGSVCYVAAWAGAVFVWRRLVVLEIKNREQQLLSAVRAAEARQEPPAAPAERPKARAA